jgi:predicted HicB family RNase H-like nuclease
MDKSKSSRSKNLNIRLTVAEALRFAKAAAREGLPVSQWVRRTLLAASER